MIGYTEYHVRTICCIISDFLTESRYFVETFQPSLVSFEGRQLTLRFPNTFGDTFVTTMLSRGMAALFDARPLILRNEQPLRCTPMLAEDAVITAAALAHANATHLLDVECRTGECALKLLKVLPKVRRCTLLERSGHLLRRATERVGAVAAGLVEPIHGDVRSWGLPNRLFDLAITSSGLRYLQHADDWLDALRQIYLALKPEGTFWCLDSVIPLELMERAGFSTVEVLQQSGRSFTFVARKV
jgi:SAM-dependent methyltransferase